MKRKSLSHLNCGWAQAAEAIGDKWSIMILRDAFCGVRTFSGFQKSLDISKNILTQRLEHLVGHNVLKRKPIDLGSARQEYVLTSKGEALFPVLVGLAQWSNEHVFGEGKEPYEFVNRASNASVKPLSVIDQSGQSLSAADLALTEGPGANENNKRLIKAMAAQADIDNG